MRSKRWGDVGMRRECRDALRARGAAPLRKSNARGAKRSPHRTRNGIVTRRAETHLRLGALCA